MRQFCLIGRRAWRFLAYWFGGRLPIGQSARTSITMRKAAALWTTMRSTVTVLSLVAWFLLSNHCALGAVVATTDPEPQMSGCPMHSAPAKKKPAAKTPCCKEIRAVVAKCVQVTALGMRPIASQDYAPEILLRPSGEAIEIDGLDTGPPDRFSFAELVLQESLRAHAPPVS